MPLSRAHRLTRRPIQRATAEDVQVQVKHRLTRARAGVDDGAITVFGQTFQRGNTGRCVQQTADNGSVMRGSVIERGNVRARNHQNMRRGLRVKVPKRDGIIIAVNDLCGNLARCDAAENTIHKPKTQSQKVSMILPKVALLSSRSWAARTSFTS